MKRSLFFICAGAILLAALILRIMGARGDLWLDEIWTLDLVRPLTSPLQIFQLNHANNHFANSLYQYALGPDASFMARRALSIVCGVLSVAAAGLWGWRRGAGAALVTMLLFTVSDVFVQYGSEARGYAGLILCSVLACWLAEECLSGKNRRLALAATIACGLLFHLLMALTAVSIGFWMLWVHFDRTRKAISTIAATWHALWPSLLVAVGFATILLTARAHHPFDMGLDTPFKEWDCRIAYTSILWGAGSIPVLFFRQGYIMLPVIAVGLAAHYLKPVGNVSRLPLYVMMTLIVPIAFYLGRVPDTGFPRYFLVSATGFIMLLGELGSVALASKREVTRSAGLIVLGLILVNDISLLRKFYVTGRGEYDEAVSTMAAEGPIRYGDSEILDFHVVDFYAGAIGVNAQRIDDTDEARWCAKPPDWYIAHKRSSHTPWQIVKGPAACPTNFTKRGIYPDSGFSGDYWYVYHRE